MSRQWLPVVLGIPAGLLLLGAGGPAYADGGGSLQHCLNQAANHNGEPPTCTQVNGRWVASWPDSSSPSVGFGGLFLVFVVLALVVGVGITLWKVTTARTLARQSGMDPGLATQMTLLTDDGLDATYLASSMRGSAAPVAAPGADLTSGPTSGPAAGRAGAEARLTELRGLLDKGLVTQGEYDERRKAIIDSV